MTEYEMLAGDIKELRKEINKLVNSVHAAIDSRVEKQAKMCRELWVMDYKISTAKLVGWLIAAGALGGGASEIINRILGG